MRLWRCRSALRFYVIFAFSVAALPIWAAPPPSQLVSHVNLGRTTLDGSSTTKSDTNFVSDTGYNGKASADFSHSTGDLPKMHMVLSADIDQQSDDSNQNVTFYTVAGNLTFRDRIPIDPLFPFKPNNVGLVLNLHANVQTFVTTPIGEDATAEMSLSWTVYDDAGKSSSTASDDWSNSANPSASYSNQIVKNYELRAASVAADSKFNIEFHWFMGLDLHQAFGSGVNGMIDGRNTLDVVGLVLYDADGNVIVPPDPISVTSELGYTYPVVPEPGAPAIAGMAALFLSQRGRRRRARATVG